MKENTLRGMVRSQIKKFMTEAPMTRAAVSTKLGSIEKMAGVKMLKKALSQGGPDQQAAGLLSVVKSISGNNPLVAKKLAQLLRKKDAIVAPELDPKAPVDEYTAGVDDGSPMEEKISSSLASRSAKVDKTQAMKNMKAALASKSAPQQAEFVADLVKGLNLKGNISLLIQKLRK